MKKTICFVTLGCAKNTVYSEYMMGLCADSDYILVEEPAEATVIVVNTCGFITAAKEETINTILALNDYKEAGSCEFLVAIGCMVQKYAKEMEEALPELLHDLCKIDGIRWIRLLYAYPNNLSDDLIATIASEEKICKYIDIPLQHADDEILARMNRKIDQAQIRALIAKLRERVPGIMIRSTFIVGFPGETEAAYNNLLNFLEEVQLDRVGVFPYSQEENTPAGRMPDQLDEAVKEERAQNLMDIQFEIMFANHQRLIGETRHVLVDDIEDGMLLCRSQSEAPDIDPYVIVPVADVSAYEIGQELDVVISDVHEYDLIGSLV